MSGVLERNVHKNDQRVNTFRSFGKPSRMKRFWIGLGIVFGLGAGSVAVIAARYEPTIRPGTKIGPVDVGGLLPNEAE